MVQSSADRLESADRPPVEHMAVKPYIKSESTKHYIDRWGLGLTENLDQELWLACSDISSSAHKEYPESWKILSDLAVKYFEHEWAQKVDELAIELKENRIDDKTQAVIIVNAKRSIYYYLHYQDHELEQPVPLEASDPKED